MGIFDFFKKSSSSNNVESNFRYGGSSIDSFFGGSSVITEEEAMQIPAFSAAVDLITGAIATLDFYIVKNNKDKTVKRIEDDPRLSLLNRQPNEYMDAYTFKKAMVKDFLLYGVSNS